MAFLAHSIAPKLTIFLDVAYFLLRWQNVSTFLKLFLEF